MMRGRTGDPSALRELAAIRLIERTLGRPRGRSVEVGIGDDAAVLRAGGRRLVWTVDACVDRVHFERRYLVLEDVGWRALSAAVSDLAAMGATPLAALSAIGLPPGFSARELERLTRGLAAAARACGCPVIGGNITRASELSLTTSVLGQVARPLRRDRARPRQELWLVGSVGMAAAGLALLESRRRARSRDARDCVAAWRRPVPLVRQGKRLVGWASAAIDVSDGLAGDLGHVARASAVRLVVEEPALRAALPSALVGAASLLGRDALELALFGGEDYALVAVGPRAGAPRFARRIGRVERGRGVVLEDERGRSRPLAGGFDHLRVRAVTCS